MIVHYLYAGRTPCGLFGPPKEWPEGHKWEGDWSVVNCRGCLASYQTFVLSDQGRAITCLRCKKTSYNANDVANHYCGWCHVFHDDIWPPARHWWLTHPDPQPKPG
jgi:hypothetical protein